MLSRFCTKLSSSAEQALNPGCWFNRMHAGAKACVVSTSKLYLLPMHFLSCGLCKVVRFAPSCCLDRGYLEEMSTAAANPF